MADIDARPEDAQNTDDRKTRLGRLAFRAWRRGFREADMVLGPFVDQVAPTLNDDELTELETLLDEEDQYLYAWIIEREPTPPEFDGPMLARIRVFMREHVAAEVAKGIG
ncbi:succinate dehydrogenase assembly factor 2 [Brevundimonas diminuta]|uniref:FAD assembly factor SdhE n=1 Tax=Brevundimonas diminuta TaxID=293 RepID=UPI002096A5FC|nr:succinate dehydrogenase assembly factor 2 [Brevundimonas diminuta]MCO8030355.1 succinate dehydrogenase assembly factor 2 [Brevundimonas diminuta]